MGVDEERVILVKEEITPPTVFDESYVFLRARVLLGDIVGAHLSQKMNQIIDDIP